MLEQGKEDMSLREFAGYVAENILYFLPGEYRDADVSIGERVGINDTLKMSINIRRPEEGITPVIALNSLYERYKTGENPANLVEEVAQIRQDMDAGVQKMDRKEIEDRYMDYGYVKENLITKICKTGWNTNRLKNAANREVGEFTMTYHINLGNVKPQGDTRSLVMITEEMLKMWGVSREQLYEDAARAEDKREPMLCTMYDVLHEMLGGERKAVNMLKTGFIPEGQNSQFMGMPNNMFVMTTADKEFGASVMVRDDILQKAAAAIGGNIYILPSSVHETIVLPESSCMDPEELSMMVSSINEAEVLPEERLSDDAFLYDRERHILKNLVTGDEIGRDDLLTRPGAGREQEKDMGSIEKEDRKPKRKHSR